MARCIRCNKFMLMKSQTGYCNDCYNTVLLEDKHKREEEERRRKAEEERRRKEDEDRKRIAEEERRRREVEERQRKEEERLRQEKEQQRKNEEERKKIEAAQSIYQRGANYRSEGQFEKAKEQFIILREQYGDVYKAPVVDSLLEDIDEQIKQKELEDKEKARVAEVKKIAEEKYKIPSSNNGIRQEEKNETQTTYKSGDFIIFGRYPQFDNEPTPVKWIILEVRGNDALLLSEYVIDSCKFHQTKDLDSCDIYWETSHIRKYLNNQMYNQLFSAEEKNAIINSIIDNKDYNNVPSDQTTDHLFLLSLDEYNKYNLSWPAKATKYAVRQGNTLDIRGNPLPESYLESKYGMPKGWWLRTKGRDRVCTMVIEDNGHPTYQGGLGPGWNQGIRPALWINLLALSSKPSESNCLSEKSDIPKSTSSAISDDQTVFSYTNWDIALGHLPFLQSTDEQLADHDGEEVISVGDQFVLKSMNPMISLDSFCIRKLREPDYTIPTIQENKDLITKLIVARRKQLLMVPYSFWTPAILYVENEFGFALVSLSEKEQWAFTMRSRIAIPSIEAARSIAMLMRSQGRVFADGVLDDDENVQVFLLSIPLLETLAKVVFFGRRDYPHIDVQSAKRYFELLFGYENEEEFHALESKYEQECSLLISTFEADRIMSQATEDNHINNPNSSVSKSNSSQKDHRVTHEEPKYQKTGFFHTKVVGVTFKNDDGSDRQRIIRDLNKEGLLSEGVELDLIPQPDNPYDNNCIRVVAKNGKQIGCLSREVAAKVAPMMRQGVIYKAFVTVQTGGDVGFAYGVNIRIETYEKGSTPTPPVTKTSTSSSYDDYDYNDEDDTDYYDYEQMQREAWNETHMNPYGTEDCGDGYIDSDGVFTEY